MLIKLSHSIPIQSSEITPEGKWSADQLKDALACHLRPCQWGRNRRRGLKPVRHRDHDPWRSSILAAYGHRFWSLSPW
jgi:hypothetical protein